MRSLRFLVLGAAAVAAFAAAPARADVGADLKAKLANGMAGVSSLRVDMTMQGMTGGSITVVIPNPGQVSTFRVKLEFRAPTVEVQGYIVDGAIYQRINGSRWERRPLPDIATVVHLGPAFGDPGNVTPLPDRIVDGVTYGAFTETPPASTTLPLPAIATFDCTYEKTTGRLHECDNPLITMTYTGFNDPANVVELPAAAADAVVLPMIPLVPPGAVAPLPSGTP